MTSPPCAGSPPHPGPHRSGPATRPHPGPSDRTRDHRRRRLRGIVATLRQPHTAAEAKHRRFGQPAPAHALLRRKGQCTAHLRTTAEFRRAKAVRKNTCSKSRLRR
jgi:hypothetical protein